MRYVVPSAIVGFSDRWGRSLHSAAWRWKRPFYGCDIHEGLQAALKRQKKTGIGLVVLLLDVLERRKN